MHIPSLLSLLLPLLAIPSTLAVDPNITVQDFIPTLDGSCSRSGHVNIIFAGEKFQRAMYQITYGQVKRCGGDTLSFKANGPQQMLNKQTNRFEGRYEATGSLTVFAKGGKKYKVSRLSFVLSNRGGAVRRR